jgi:cytochrome c
MPQQAGVWAIAVMLCAATGCESGRRSPAGFRLAPDGDVERGKVAFVALGCTNCHEVAGVGLPQPANPLVQRVILGGEVNKETGDGRLVRSIIDPSPKVRNGLLMPHQPEQMTVRQLTDIVAFLQSRYTLRRLTPAWTYY